MSRVTPRVLVVSLAVSGTVLLAGCGEQGPTDQPAMVAVVTSATPEPTPTPTPVATPTPEPTQIPVAPPPAVPPTAAPTATPRPTPPTSAAMPATITEQVNGRLLVVTVLFQSWVLRAPTPEYDSPQAVVVWRVHPAASIVQTLGYTDVAGVRWYAETRTGTGWFRGSDLN